MTAILSPCSGRVIALDEVPDPVFAGRIVGPGVAIDPDRSAATVVAPISGRLVKLHPHAFVIAGADVAVLVHLGIDTVQLKGEGFTVHVTKGQKVTAGTPLVTFDRGVIEAAGYPLVTPIIVLNAKKFGGVETTAQGEIAVGDTILAVAPAPVPAEAGL